MIYAIPYVTESPNVLSNDIDSSGQEKSLESPRKQPPKRPTGLNDIHMVPFVML